MSQRRANINEQVAASIGNENRAKERSVRLTKQQTKATQEFNRNRLRAFAVMTKSRGVMLGFSSRLGFFNQAIDGIGKAIFGIKSSLIKSIKGIRKSSKDIIPKNVTMSMKALRQQLIGQLRPGAAGAFQRGQFAVRQAFTGLSPGAGAGAGLLGGLNAGGRGGGTPFAGNAQRMLSRNFALPLSQSLQPATQSVGGRAFTVAKAPVPFTGTGARGPPKETSKFFKSFNKSGKASKSFGKNIIKPLAGFLAQGALSLVSMSAMIIFTQLLNGLVTVFQPVLSLFSTFITQVSLGFLPLVVALVEEFTKPEFLASIAEISETVRVAALDMIASGFVEEMAALVLSILESLPEISELVFALIDLGAAVIPLLPVLTGLVTGLTDLFTIVNDLLGLVSTERPEGFSGGGAGPGTRRGEPSGNNPIVDLWRTIFPAANGAVVNPPGGLFQVGEGTETELITPVSLMRQVIREETGGGGGGQAITINISLNGVAPGSDINELSRIIARKIGFALQ